MGDEPTNKTRNELRSLPCFGSAATRQPSTSVRFVSFFTPNVLVILLVVCMCIDRLCDDLSLVSVPFGVRAAGALGETRGWLWDIGVTRPYLRLNWPYFPNKRTGIGTATPLAILLSTTTWPRIPTLNQDL